MGGDSVERSEIETWYARLVPLCRAALAATVDHDRQLFSRQLFDGVWSEIDDIYPHETLTSSCISLIGLAAANIDPSELGVDPERAMAAIIGEFERTGYVGGIGLALWAAAAMPTTVDHRQLLAATGLALSTLRSDLAPRLTTMELAWLTTGLCHQATTTGSDEVAAAAVACADALMAERIDVTTGLPCHATTSAPTRVRLRRNLPNFADQIYTVQALAAAGTKLSHASAVRPARRLADRLCEFQGDHGQWWWHYDSRRGQVAQRFAVYSVHQHAMAPMALAELAELDDGSNFAAAIVRSLAWLDDNESGSTMVDPAAGTIWRSLELEQSVVARGRGVVRELVGETDRGGAAGAVRINRETRPYEWAWCLYADAVLRRAIRPTS